jgi:hypothetical protein
MKRFLNDVFPAISGLTLSSTFAFARDMHLGIGTFCGGTALILTLRLLADPIIGYINTARKARQ